MHPHIVITNHMQVFRFIMCTYRTTLLTSHLMALEWPRQHVHETIILRLLYSGLDLFLFITVTGSPPMAQLSKLDGPVPRAIDERMSPETRAAYIPQVWVPSIPLRSLKAPETQENRDGGIMIIAIAVAVGSSSTMSC